MTSPGIEQDAPATPQWGMAGLLLEALAARDFGRMTACLAPAATMRALTPSGLTELEGAAQVVDRIRTWFGDATEFDVLDGTVGEVGGRVHVAWRLRLHPTPWGDDSWHVIEQQTYLRIADRIEAIDLLCSGFQPDPAVSPRKGSSR